VLADAYVTRQHCGSGVAGGHPPAKIAICAGTRLLAVASKNRFGWLFFTMTYFSLVNWQS
jgi:hypothetical protein